MNIKQDLNIEFLNGTLRLRRYDSQNYVIEKLSLFEAERDFGNLKKGQKTERWKWLGYYPNLSYACNRLLDEGVIGSEATSIKDLKAALNNTKQEIKEKLLNV